MRTKAGPKKVTRPEASQQRPAQAKLTTRGRAKGSRQVPAQAPVIKRRPGRPKRSQQGPAQTPVTKRGRSKRAQQDHAQASISKRAPGRPRRFQQELTKTPTIKRGPGRWPKRSQQDAAQTPVMKGDKPPHGQQDPAESPSKRGPGRRPKRSQQDPAQTSATKRELRSSKGIQQDPARAEGSEESPKMPKRSHEDPAGAEVTRSKRPKVSLQDAAKKTSQSKKGPKRKRAQTSVAHSSQPSKQAAKGRKRRAAQRQAEVWPTMQDSLDIDFQHWNPDEIAQQWNARARAAIGEGNQGERQELPDPSFSDLTTEDMGHYAPGPSAAEHDEQLEMAPAENVARAAFKKRKRVAIPEDELARLGLSANSGETPEAAKQFWAGEELVHVGGGRFYPCRYVREEGDMPVAEWMQKEAQGHLPPGDYDVIAIVDERKRGTSKEYIVKWKGFELNAEQWLPRNVLAKTKAMQAWAQKRAVDGQWHASSHAEGARLSARAAKPPVDKKPEEGKGLFQQALW